MSENGYPIADLASQADGLGATAATIVNDLQQRFDQLRQWHGQAEQTLAARKADLERREFAAENSRATTREHRLRLKAYRRRLTEQRTEHRQGMADLEKDRNALDLARQKVERTTVELADERAELRRLREEMDGEWANLTRLRRAQETLAAALDADRERVTAQRFQLVGKLADLTDRRAA